MKRLKMKQIQIEKKSEKEIVFTEQDIEEIKTSIADLDIPEIDDIENLRKIKDSGRIGTAKVFVICYNIFKDYHETIKNSKIPKFLIKFYYVNLLKNDLEEYADGEGWGSHYSGERIKDTVDSKREEMNSLIKLFFNVCGSEI